MKSSLSAVLLVLCAAASFALDCAQTISGSDCEIQLGGIVHTISGERKNLADGFIVQGRIEDEDWMAIQGTAQVDTFSQSIIIGSQAKLYFSFNTITGRAIWRPASTQVDIIEGAASDIPVKNAFFMPATSGGLQIRDGSLTVGQEYKVKNMFSIKPSSLGSNEVSFKTFGETQLANSNSWISFAADSTLNGKLTPTAVEITAPANKVIFVKTQYGDLQYAASQENSITYTISTGELTIGPGMLYANWNDEITAKFNQPLTITFPVRSMRAEQASFEITRGQETFSINSLGSPLTVTSSSSAIQLRGAGVLRTGDSKTYSETTFGARSAAGSAEYNPSTSTLSASDAVVKMCADTSFEGSVGSSSIKAQSIDGSFYCVTAAANGERYGAELTFAESAADWQRQKQAAVAAMPHHTSQALNVVGNTLLVVPPGDCSGTVTVAGVSVPKKIQFSPGVTGDLCKQSLSTELADSVTLRVGKTAQGWGVVARTGDVYVSAAHDAAQAGLCLGGCP